MDTYLSHDTSLEYWRLHFPLDSELGLAAHMRGKKAGSSRKVDVLGSIPEEFAIPGQPVDALIFDEVNRRRSSSVVCHLWHTKVPKGAFYKVRGVYVSSPEFTFLQMASKLPVEQLIALGCELCGQYVLLPRGITHPGSLDEMPKRLYPLTNTKRIAAFINAAGKARGKEKAIRAVKYVVDGSRSPMETMTYMLLCLPVMLGGYGLPKPELNAVIPLDDEAKTIARRQHCEGDLCWSDAQLDVEYHGEVHVGAAQMKSDVGRELGIEHMGWRVITVTSPQVFDVDQFEVVAKETAARMAKRLRKSTLGATPQRNALRHELTEWMFGSRG